MNPTATLPNSSSRIPFARLTELLDRDSVELLAESEREGALAVRGTVAGQPAVVFATDPAVRGGAMGSETCDVIVSAYNTAMRQGCPVLGLWQSGGARLDEGVHSLHGVGQVFVAMTDASGRILQVSVVHGPAAGGAAYGPALTDIVISAPAARIFVTGPDVVRSVTGEQVNAEELGGPDAHAIHSGVVHLLAADDRDALHLARRVVTLFSCQGEVDLGAVEERDLGAILPESARWAYDVRPLVHDLLDHPGLELHPRWSSNIVTVLGRLGGRTVGVVANNPAWLAGCLDCTSAEKAARFVRMCDAFGIPLLVVVDTPGYLPGTAEEWGGIVRRGAKLLHAFAEARVPRVTLVTRKAYGGAYVAMNSRALRASRVYAWPTAEVAVMGAVAAVRILHRRALAAVPEAQRPGLEAQLADEHQRGIGGIDRAVALGVVDEVISPRATRRKLAQAFQQTPALRGRHANIPL